MDPYGPYKYSSWLFCHSLTLGQWFLWGQTLKSLILPFYFSTKWFKPFCVTYSNLYRLSYMDVETTFLPYANLIIILPDIRAYVAPCPSPGLQTCHTTLPILLQTPRHSRTPPLPPPPPHPPQGVPQHQQELSTIVPAPRCPLLGSWRDQIYSHCCRTTRYGVQKLFFFWILLILRYFLEYSPGLKLNLISN